MLKFPIISGKKLLKVLKKHGFCPVRQKGSHIFVESDDQTLRTVIPLHGNEDLGKGLLSAILSDLELSIEDLIRML